MISGIGNYIHGGFYQNRGDIFDSALLSYCEKPNQESTDIIRSLMMESGFREEDNCFIDIEREFFSDGKLDSDKCDKFKKELILHYSLNQLKYTFFGTSSKMTKITEDSLKREGKDISDYLPVKERRKREKSLKHRILKERDEKKRQNRIPIYLYGDGSLSTDVIKEKGKTEFNRLGGNSGAFDFTKGYDPNLKVEKKEWLAGFNREKTWEIIERDNNPKKNISYVDSYREAGIDVELLFDGEELYIIDSSNILLDGLEEEYYSASGQLYAKREIDREKSIESIKEAAKDSGIKFIKGIILKDEDKESIKFYKESFKEFITGETEFAVRGDNNLSNTVSKIKERDREEQLSNNILTQFQALKSENRSPDEITAALQPADNICYSAELNIFNNPEDMAIFFSQDSASKLDNDIKEYIISLDVPKEASKELSRSFQNIINNKTITHETKLNRGELLKKSYNRVVKKDKSEEETIIKTVTLSTLLKDKNSKIIDLNDRSERTNWLKENIEKPYTENLSKKAEAILVEKQITEEENLNIINAFNHIGDITSSTGMTPIELINYAFSDDKKDKMIHIQKDLNDILDETAKTAPKNADIYLPATVTDTSFNLINPVDIIHFVNNNLAEDDNKEKLIEYLRSKPVSIKDSREFSLDLVKALNNRSRFPGESSSLNIARTIAESINGKSKKIDKLVEKSLNIYKKSEPSEIRYNLLDNKDLNLFKSDPILSSFDSDEVKELITYLNSKPVSNSNSEEFSEAILKSLEQTSSFPEYTSARDIAESIALKVNGLTVPSKHKEFVDTVFNSYDIKELTKNPDFEKLSSEHQAELINFLKTKPVVKEQSKAYIEDLVKGIKNNGNKNPTEYAKDLSRALKRNTVTTEVGLDIKENLNTVPLRYNFAERTSIDSFSSDPIFTAFSLDEQNELLSYLKTSPIPLEKSKEFSETLIAGLKEKRENPVEFAKILSKVITGESIKNVPNELIPVLSKSLKVNNNKVVPLSYNFSDKGDVNKFKFDPILRGFSEPEQEALFNYLKSGPVSVKNSPQFSSRLTSGLKSLPKSIRPLSFASNLALSMNASKYSQSKTNKSYNLMDSSSLSSFYKTKMFRDSGVNRASFTNMINSHKSNISSYKPNSSVSFPMSFRSVNSDNGVKTPIDVTNNIYNQSHVVKRSRNNSRPVIRNINSNRKVKDVYKAFKEPVNSFSPKPSVNTQNINTAQVNNMGRYTNHNNPTSRPVPKPKLSPEEERMQRIQQNYINDKQAIENQGNPQMLAKSKTKDVGSAGMSGGNNKSGGRAVTELSSSLTEEIKRNLDSSFL